MYANISSDFKSEVKKNARNNRGYIVLPDGTTVDNFVQGEFFLEQNCYVDGSIIGNAIAKNFECKIYNDGDYDLFNKEIKVFTGVKYTNGTTEYVPWGTFIIDECENIESSNTLSIKAFDYMVKFNPTYNDNMTYPCRLKDWVNNFCNVYGVGLGNLEYVLTEDVEIDNSKRYYYIEDDIYKPVEEPKEEDLSGYYEIDIDLPNQNFIIFETPEYEGLTGREILKNIAAMMGKFATIGRDDLLYFKLSEMTDTEISRNSMSSLTINEATKPINGVVIRLGDVEGENITLLDEESIETYGENDLVIVDNIFLNSQEKRQAAIQEIFDAVDGFSYIPFNCEWNSFMYNDCGDIIQVQYMDSDDYFYTILLNQSLKIPATTKSTIKSDALTNNQVEYQFTPEQIIANKKTQIRVDKVEQKITSVVETQNNQQSQLSQVVQTIGDIQNLFQLTGGNNLIKDSMGLLDDDVWEYGEEGEYEYGYDAELIGQVTSVAKRKITNGYMKTLDNNITDLVVGSQYTLSFKISNDENTTTTVKLTGNNVAYEQTWNEKLNMEEVSYSFIADTSTYTLEITSETILSGSGTLFDIMLNKGDVSTWQPAAGEIVGTVIKLSQQGLQIYCTGSEIATLMTAQGFQIRRFSNGNLYEVVTEFTKDGLITNKAQIIELEVNKYEFKTIEYNNNDTLIIYKKEGE